MPIDEIALQKERSRGLRAQQLLENDLLNEAFDVLKDAYVEHWQATPIADVQGREKLFLAVNVLGKVRQQVETVISRGKMAAAELKQMADEVARTAERKKRFGIV